MKKHLLMAAMLAVATTAWSQNAETPTYEAAALDGHQIVITNGANQNSRLTVTNNLVATTTSVDKTSYTWTAEYDQTEDGVILQLGDVYMACLPVVTDNAFNNKTIATTTNKDEAGRYRFYNLADKYALTSTKSSDGNAIESIGTFGAYGDNSGWWVQGPNADGNVVRWGSNPNNSKWTLELVDEELTVDLSSDNMTFYRYTSNTRTWAESTTWSQYAETNDVFLPKVKIAAGSMSNNIMVDNTVTKGFRHGGNGESFIFSVTDNDYYYISKISFSSKNTTANTSANSYVCKGQSYPTSGEYQDFNFEFTVEDLPATITFNGGNNQHQLENVVVTLKRISQDEHQIMVDGYTSYFETNFEPYAHYPSLFSEAGLQTTRSAFDALIAEYPNSFPADFNTQIDALILATPLDLSTPLAVKFKGQRTPDQDYYMSINPSNPTKCYTVNNGHEPALIWILSKAEDAEKVRLTHFMTGKELGNNNQRETIVDLVEAGQGFDFFIHPVKTSTGTYYVELHDNNASYSYIHEATDHRVVKWNSVAAGSTPSGWELIVVEQELEESLTTDVAYDFSFDTTGDAAMHTFTFTHESGISRANGTSGEIVIRKITFKSTEDENEPAAVKARVAENNSYEYADVEPAATIDVDDATATDNGLILSCNRLDAGSYEMAVPEHVFMVGSGSTARLNKAAKSIITVDADGGITGIDEVAAAVAPVVEGIYDLQGRKLTKPVKGINIINGRKVFVK